MVYNQRLKIYFTAILISLLSLFGCNNTTDSTTVATTTRVKLKQQLLLPKLKPRQPQI